MLGIDVTEIKEIEIKDAKFKIGVIPYKTRINLTSLSVKLARKGKDSITDEVDVWLQQQVDFVKFGVKGHSGIQDKNGKELLFKANADGTVSDDTLNMYLAMNIVPDLFTQIHKFNNLSEDEQKN